MLVNFAFCENLDRQIKNLSGNRTEIQLNAEPTSNETLQLSCQIFRQVVLIEFLVLTVANIALLFWFLKGIVRKLEYAKDDVQKLGRGQKLGPVRAGHDEFAELDKELRQMATLLSESSKRERAVIENAVDVICVIDVQSCFVSVSPACKPAWGYPADELVGHSLSEFLALEDVEGSLRAAIGAEHSIDKVTFENRFKRKNGEYINLLWSAHWSASDKGLFCVVHDITDRKAAEELLRQSEERIRAMLESLPVSLVIINKLGYIEFTNSTTERMTGFSYTELVGEQLSVILPEKLKSYDMAGIDSLIKECRNRVVGGVATRKDGETFPADISISEFSTRGESKFMVILLDVTERQEIERMKHEFVAMISHDLRTPLTSLQTLLVMMEEGILGTLTERGAKLAVQGRKETERLMRLIRDLLDLEKMQTGKFTMHFEEMSMRGIIETSVAAVRKFAETRNITIMVPENDSRCQADGGRLIQVLINLLSNAIKFSPSQETIKVLLEETENELKISVCDNGRGVPKDKAALIFEKYQQVENNDAKQKGGVGLGLAICKTIIEQHGGKIGVESTPGKGSTFWFSIPKDSVAVVIN